MKVPSPLSRHDTTRSDIESDIEGSYKDRESSFIIIIDENPPLL